MSIQPGLSLLRSDFFCHVPWSQKSLKDLWYHLHIWDFQNLVYQHLMYMIPTCRRVALWFQAMFQFGPLLILKHARIEHLNKLHTPHTMGSNADWRKSCPKSSCETWGSLVDAAGDFASLLALTPCKKCTPSICKGGTLKNDPPSDHHKSLSSLNSSHGSVSVVIEGKT